jgi:hypothetical protein
MIRHNGATSTTLVDKRTLSSWVGRFLVNKLTQEGALKVKLQTVVADCFKSQFAFENGHINTPTDDVFTYSGESMQNPLSWCRVHV